MRDHLLTYFSWIVLNLGMLAFWHAVLLGGSISKARLAWLSLGIGMLFLGKFCFNVFAAGALLCLLAGQWRKLFLILPAVALPTVLWFLMTKPLGYVYGVSEVSDCGAGVWLLKVGSFGNLLHEIAAFLSQWFKCLGESASLFHLPFAALGTYGLWKNGGRMFLGVALLAALVDMGFYFLVHRNNANYGMSTLLFFFVLVALGVQSALNWRQLPQYGG